MIEFVVVLLCLFLNAILAAVEMAFVTVTKPRLRELARSGRREARRILRLRENPERTLSVIQIGITAVGALAAAVGGASASGYFAPWVAEATGLSSRTSGILSLIAVVLPITYSSVVIGELVPKTLALRNPLAIVLRAARWLVFFDRLLSPIVTFLEASTRLVVKVIRPQHFRKSNSPIDEDVELDQLSSQAREYVLNLVDVEKMRIGDLRLPWSEVVFVAFDSTAIEVERVALASGHTRLPVFRDGDVVGILNTKEFMVFRNAGQGDWRVLVREVVKVDESSPILRALKRMQDKRSHLSITYVNGRLSGIVTMEDVLEEIIGDIYDEDDDGILRRVLSTGSRSRIYRPPINRGDDLVFPRE